ncbi:helix-turn-helix domain-containing protein [Enterovirga rhinocerotis]|uniref:DNA-binding XRE family transcriptional regulator n=1 Tax=Enterovirga rhinocerotis TaxID=1339210 RepID=A0A4R7CAC9_9HYPH|nr:helix-turn-helix transcriptional regulator [Enterovirga rhinocerotis]TDR93747.1 DNA-binding XRE family transcriptional regulator [Enterovirga rhinocerotis]
MNAQTIVTPSGERLVVLAEEDFRKLVEAAEDAEDQAAVSDFQRKLAAGDEELLPDTMVERILAGENRIRIWREHRGLSLTALSGAAGIGQGFLSQIESGQREGSLDTLRKVATVLRVSLDDLAG